MDGRIKIHRKMIERGRHTDPITLSVFMHILRLCNYETKEWKGITINAGQLLTGIYSLSKSTGITEQSIRTALKHLKSTNEITIKSTNQFSIITVVKWEEYQSNECKLTSKLTSKLTNDQQATNKQLTTTKEIQEEKNNNINMDLENFVAKWNNIKTINSKKGLPEIRKINSAVIDIWNKKRKEYTVDEIIDGVNNYCKDITKRVKRNDTDIYPDHRFTLFEFLKQKNGLDTFINK